MSENEDRIYDVAIIGGGPAGLTAAIYGARSGLSSVIIESVSAGGQMAQTEHLENYPGYSESTSGFDLSETMLEQAQSFGAEIVYDEVVSIEDSDDAKTLRCAFGDVRARSIIIATGARPAKLGIDKELELTGSGVSYCATCDGNFFRDKDVVIVGGGDTAVADAIYLSRICRKVYMVVRRDVLRATAIYHDRVKELDNVEILWNSIVERISDEDGSLCGVDARNRISDELRFLDVSALFVAIGTVPNTEFLCDMVELDQRGYVVADESCCTSAPGIFVAGDARTKRLRQVTTAVGDGANCIESVSEYLIDSH